jgi:hypothetical protein
MADLLLIKRNNHMLRIVVSFGNQTLCAVSKDFIALSHLNLLC